MDEALKFDIAALRKAAGEKMFGRGEAYADQGQVEIVGVDEGRVLGVAFGQETYRVELARRARGFAGDCTCPAFADGGVCKHMIALALVAQAASAGELAEAQGRLARLRTYLLGLKPEVLVETLLTTAIATPELLERLEMEADEGGE